MKVFHTSNRQMLSSWVARDASSLCRGDHINHQSKEWVITHITIPPNHSYRRFDVVAATQPEEGAVDDRKSATFTFSGVDRVYAARPIPRTSSEERIWDNA